MYSKTIDQRLYEIMSRCLDATKGPWKWYEDMLNSMWLSQRKNRRVGKWFYFLASTADVEFNDPKLVNEIVRCEMEDADLKSIMRLKYKEAPGLYRAMTPEDKEFIAHSRMDVPWLLMAVKCLLQPEFRELLNRIEQVTDDNQADSFCAKGVWHGCGGNLGFKQDFSKLIGHESMLDDPTGMLYSSDAYDVGYEILYSRLPACRNCGCSKTKV